MLKIQLPIKQKNRLVNALDQKNGEYYLSNSLRSFSRQYIPSGESIVPMVGERKKDMDELKRLLQENPKAKEEFDNIIEILNMGSIEQIKMWIEYANELEEMIEANVSRKDMLQTIDNFNHLTEQMRYSGSLKEDETWWESVL